MDKITLLLLLLTLNSSIAFSQTKLSQSNEDWHFVAAPYLFLSSLSGESGVGVTGTTEVQADFSDLLKNLEFGFMFHGEAQKGSWGFMVDMTYVKLGGDISTPINGIVDINVKELILESFVNYRVYKEWGQIDIFGGIRIWDVDLDLDLDLAGGLFTGIVSRGDSWVDPVVGSRILYKLSESWFTTLRADIGGFGIGSDFSWNIQPSLGYKFTNAFSLVGQYKYLSVDFSSGEPMTSQFFAYDINMTGPVLGFVFQF